MRPKKCEQDSKRFREAGRADLVLQEAIRQLARQEAHVDAFHSRSVNLLVVESVVAALFGANSVLKPGEHLSGMKIIAFFLFFVTVVLVISIQWPREYIFAYDLSAWVERMKTGESIELTDFSFNVARDLTDALDLNEPKIKSLARLFTALCLAVGAQVLAWGISVL
jgi:hypothetical protein